MEENSSWDETLLIVTADHETGYLSGPSDEDHWKPLTGEAGELPRTGAELGLAGGIAAGLVALGSTAVYLARRRQQH